MRKTVLLFSVLVLFIGLSACNSQKHLASKQSSYMEKTYKGLKDSLQEAQITLLNDTIKILFPENLLFKTSESNPSENSKPLLKRFARALNKYSKTNILINGYADNTGTEDYNTKLSTERAENTKNVLTEEKVANQRMLTWGRGNSNPIASNTTAEGRRLNRRVEFIILYRYNSKK